MRRFTISISGNVRMNVVRAFFSCVVILGHQVFVEARDTFNGIIIAQCSQSTSQLEEDDEEDQCTQRS